MSLPTGSSTYGLAQPLTTAESARLARLERTVDRAVEVVGKIAGEALATIRDERLYRLTHSSFEDYVITRWGFSRATAYRMIEAASPPALAPGEEPPEGSPEEAPEDEPAGQRVSARDKPSIGGEGFGDDGWPPDTYGRRLWAEVAAVDPGYLQLAAGAQEYPPVGARVMLVWSG